MVHPFVLVFSAHSGVTGLNVDVPTTYPVRKSQAIGNTDRGPLNSGKRLTGHLKMIQFQVSGKLTY